MLSYSVTAVALLFAFFTARSSAGPVINNGMIVVQNDWTGMVNVEVFYKGAVALPTLMDHKENLPPKATWIANRCCYAAGTWYQVKVTYLGGVGDVIGMRTPFTDVNPALCNPHGIPYGYARVQIRPYLGAGSWEPSLNRAIYADMSEVGRGTRYD